jgi:hypothetical protein
VGGGGWVCSPGRVLWAGSGSAERAAARAFGGDGLRTHICRRTSRVSALPCVVLLYSLFRVFKADVTVSTLMTDL